MIQTECYYEKTNIKTDNKPCLTCMHANVCKHTKTLDKAFNAVSIAANSYPDIIEVNAKCKYYSERIVYR